MGIRELLVFYYVRSVLLCSNQCYATRACHNQTDTTLGPSQTYRADSTRDLDFSDSCL